MPLNIRQLNDAFIDRTLSNAIYHLLLAFPTIVHGRSVGRSAKEMPRAAIAVPASFQHWSFSVVLFRDIIVWFTLGVLPMSLIEHSEQVRLENVEFRQRLPTDESDN